MIRIYNDIELEFRDEPTYSTNSTDNPRLYSEEYIREEADGYYAAAHGITARKDDLVLSSAIVLGTGGATGIHENSVAFDGISLYIGAGDTLFSLSIPALKLNWAVKVDFATCVGVYWLEHIGCVVKWGEVSIGCYTTTGKEQWSSEGPDIFTEGFELSTQHAIVTDFNGDKFKVNLNTSDISRTSA